MGGRITRRGFVGGAGAVAVAHALGLLGEATQALAQEVAQAELAPGDPAVRRTMTAFADTIVPGPAGGADAAPGAVEAGAVDELYDPFYGAASTFPLIHRDLAAATPRVLGRPAEFTLGLPYPDRERVLEERIASYGDGGSNPMYLLYQGSAIVVYVSYYGTARSRAGVDYIGFPPESDGYWPRSSYRVRFRGMTRTGNPG